ncbi:hypothetical protein AAMO2058_001229400 [Amorphochlora amoebiformis]
MVVSSTFIAIACVTFLAVGTIGGMIPYALRVHSQLSQRQMMIFSVLNCLSGGVLLAAGFIHMLPNMLEDGEKLKLSFPTSMLSCMLGLLIPFLIEKSELMEFVSGPISVASKSSDEGEKANGAYPKEIKGCAIEEFETCSKGKSGVGCGGMCRSPECGYGCSRQVELGMHPGFEMGTVDWGFEGEGEGNVDGDVAGDVQGSESRGSDSGLGGCQGSLTGAAGLRAYAEVFGDAEHDRFRFKSTQCDQDTATKPAYYVQTFYGSIDSDLSEKVDSHKSPVAQKSQSAYTSFGLHTNDKEGHCIDSNTPMNTINNINNINDINNNINCNASLNHSHGPSVFKMRGNNVAISHLLLFLLSVHSICAGISFGAIKKVGTAVGLFIAIICHKGFAGFALGMSFRQNSIDVASASCAILMFSSMTPLGAMIGFVTCRIASGDTSLWFSVIFKGIAAGSFIYISLVEILLEEFNGEKKRASKISKLCGFFIGNLAMTVLGYYVCPG